MNYSNFLQHTLTGQVIKAENDYFAHGGSGDIYKGIWAKNHSDSEIIVVAVKVPRVVVTDTEELAKCTQRLLRETRVSSLLSHKNITPFFGISFDFHRAPTPCLVSKYYYHGNLVTYLKQNPGVNRIQLIIQVASALSYLHNMPHVVVHGDIKAANILINDNLEASLSDFGVSRIMEQSGFTTKTFSGTMRWIAHELINVGENERIPPITRATDVWAFAMTVIEILTGRLPFHRIMADLYVPTFVQGGGRPRRWDSPEIRDDIWAMLARCWETNPTHRPSMTTLTRFFESQLSPLHRQPAPSGR